MSDPLHQQAEAVAKQIAQRLNNHWADDRSVPDVIALIVPVLQDLRQRVQAETLEELKEKRWTDAPDYYDGDDAQTWANGYNDAIADLNPPERIARDE